MKGSKKGTLHEKMELCKKRKADKVHYGKEQ